MKRGIYQNRKQLHHLSLSFVLTVTVHSDLHQFLSVCVPLPHGAGAWLVGGMKELDMGEKVLALLADTWDYENYIYLSANLSFSSTLLLT